MMQQQDVIIKQLAQKITDFIEPVIPYLVIGSKKAAEEADKEVGLEVWETKKNLWKKLCSAECAELKKAAGDMVIAPSDLDVKQVLTQEILKLLENNPDLAKEISSFMENEAIKSPTTENISVRTIKQNSKEGSKQTLVDRVKVFEEFNRLLEEFVARNNFSQGMEKSKIVGTEKPFDPGTMEEMSPSALRMAQIAEITQVTRTDSAKTNATETDIKIKNESQKTKVLLSLASRLEKTEKEETMKEALDFASQVQYGDLRSQALSLVVQHLDGSKKAKLIEKSLESASHIQDEDERAIVLSSLLPHLKGQGKEELIEKIFCFTPYLQYGDTKFQIFSSLIPHLYGSRNEEVIEKALEIIPLIFSDYQKIQALSFLVPYLSGQKQQEIIEYALELASNLKDKDMRPQALSFILPYLSESRKKEILEEALVLASEIKSKSQKTEALSSLAPYLDESERDKF